MCLFVYIFRYYLGFASFWELFLNAFVSTLLVLFIFNFLVSRGYWQKDFQPAVDSIKKFIEPVYLLLEPYTTPMLAPLYIYYNKIENWISIKLHSPAHINPKDRQHIREEEPEIIPGIHYPPLHISDTRPL